MIDRLWHTRCNFEYSVATVLVIMMRPGVSTTRSEQSAVLNAGPLLACASQHSVPLVLLMPCRVGLLLAW